MDFKKKYRYVPVFQARLENAWGGIVRKLFNQYPLSDRKGTLSCEPVFIVSAGRSGTTLLRSMLAASFQIAIPPETQIIHQLVSKFYTIQNLHWKDICRLVVSSFESHQLFPLWDTNLYPAYKKAFDIPEEDRCLARIIDEVFKTYAEQHFPSALCWGDQSPAHTFFLPTIQSVLPTGKYIHLVRDSRDVVSSFITRFGVEKMQEATYRWVESVKRVQKFQSKVNVDQMIEVKYEDLVKNPEPKLVQICNFVGITYKSSMLDYWKLPTTIEHKFQSYHQNIGKPVFTSSIGKWKEKLTKDQQDYVLSHTEYYLKLKGYLDD